jgi:hydroxymethylbilane synthase
MSARVLKVGTRGSALALAQAHWVAKAIEAATGSAPEIIIIKTEGDRSAEKDAPFGSRVGVFVREIETALTDNRIDIAVHSMKDVPTSLAEGTVIAAVPEREDARDCLVSRSGSALSDLAPGSRIGTSSARRHAQLLRARPDLVPVPIRGNVDTRLRKVTEGFDDIEAVILAMAGLARLGFSDRATEVLDFERFLTAAGQGALAIQTRTDDDETLSAARALDHFETHAACEAERAFMRTLGAGCRTPAAAHASFEGGCVTLLGAVYSPDGSHAIVGDSSADVSGVSRGASMVGETLAAEFTSHGAGDILELSREA